MKSIGSLFLFLMVSIHLQASSLSVANDDVRDFSEHVFQISEVMLHDVISPPAAARFYAYTMLGAYQVMRYQHHQMPAYPQYFRETPDFEILPLPKKFDEAFVATYAMLAVGRDILPSGYLLEEKISLFTQAYSKKHPISDEVLKNNVAFAEQIAAQVMKYAKSDGYNKLSTYTRYTPMQGQEGHWYPTPPAYIAAVEPNWEFIRPFFLDSAAQFSPVPPAPFSKDSTSAFHQQVMEVYHTVVQLSDEQREIASFWDCNPFAVKFSGHMAIGLKKISPGGHWMGITGIACQKAGVSLDTAIMIHTLEALTLHDAFISCWQEKYNSDRIRPETVINQSIDRSWKPLLQTPPFPEYTSGHSVVSSASAVILTHFLGDQFSFDDNSEVYFGLPIRHFNSFFEASNEAAISRLYGGIHFRDAIEEGVVQGKGIGNFIVSKVVANQKAAGK